MQIPRKYIDNFTKALNKLTADAQKRLADDLAKINFDGNIATIRDMLITRMEFYCGPYTDMAAIVAAEFYDGLRKFQTGAALGALAESGREPIATEKAVRAIMQDVVEGKPTEVVVRKLIDRVDYEIKKSAGECVYRNGKRDPLKPRYARVPSGGETCEFCIMLASRGFVYLSEESARDKKGGGHYHANCDCRIVPGFDGETTIPGYDPDKLYDQWKNPDKYPELREARNERRRELYAAKKSTEKGRIVERGISAKKFPVEDARVDLDYINSSEYRAKFSGMTGSEKADAQLHASAVAMLTHRNGTYLEDLHLVSVVDGEVKGRSVSSKTPLEVEATKSVKDAVRGNPPNTLFAIHNHPSNIPPTGSDFVAASARKYMGAAVVLHNGDIYCYRHGDSPFSANALDMTIANYVNNHGLSKTEAAERAMKDFEGRFGITWRKI